MCGICIFGNFSGFKILFKKMKNVRFRKIGATYAVICNFTDYVRHVYRHMIYGLKLLFFTLESAIARRADCP